MPCRNHCLQIIIALSITAVLTAVICYLYCSNFYPVPDKETRQTIIKEKDYVQMLFVGDLMFDRGIRYYAAQNKSNDYIFEKISTLLKSEDLVVANLEGPITSNKSISLGSVAGSYRNYFFTFDPSVAKTIFDQNIRLVSLGNNHILNFGQDGVASTKKYLDEAGVDYFGAPSEDHSIVKNIGGVKIAFVSYNEFGGDPESEQNFVKSDIAKLDKEADIVVVFCHWGAEYALKPAESVQILAHKMVDAGADLVIGGHPHVIEPMEDYNGKRIYYSLGNFVFDQYFNEDVRNSIGVEVKIDKSTKKLKFTEKHFYLDSNGQTVEKTFGK